MLSCSLRHYLGLLLHVREVWPRQRIMMADSLTGPISLQTPDTAFNWKTLKHFPCPANLTLSVHPLDQVAGSRSHIKIFKAGTNIFQHAPDVRSCLTDTKWSHSALRVAPGPRTHPVWTNQSWAAATSSQSEAGVMSREEARAESSCVITFILIIMVRGLKITIVRQQTQKSK